MEGTIAYVQEVKQVYVYLYFSWGYIDSNTIKEGTDAPIIWCLIYRNQYRQFDTLVCSFNNILLKVPQHTYIAEQGSYECSIMSIFMRLYELGNDEGGAPLLV
eukprot:TRINITY_DN23957_c0_g1_i3.p6 TRINITY_DN23957_c0_g1~~TRINITY_DN23957_c0_g1_i3.p6  ORF type:complete len:103 (-),score=0.93 TRINITY_DN23957_c0_g1_i3:272-580(-)